MKRCSSSVNVMRRTVLGNSGANAIDPLRKLRRKFYTAKSDWGPFLDQVPDGGNIETFIAEVERKTIQAFHQAKVDEDSRVAGSRVNLRTNFSISDRWAINWLAKNKAIIDCPADESG